MVDDPSPWITGHGVNEVSDQEVRGLGKGSAPRRLVHTAVVARWPGCGAPHPPAGCSPVRPGLDCYSPGRPGLAWTAAPHTSGVHLQSRGSLPGWPPSRDVPTAPPCKNAGGFRSDNAIDDAIVGRAYSFRRIAHQRGSPAQSRTQALIGSVGMAASSFEQDLALEGGRD